MANIDQQGNKVARTKFRKKDKSKQERIIIKSEIHESGGKLHNKHCIDCGYRSRGSEHSQGQHHLTAEV